MIQIPLQPQPQPLSEENTEPPLLHNARIRIIQIRELHPQLGSFPHPQFVATRSLIRKPPQYLQCILCWGKKRVTKKRKIDLIFTNQGRFAILRNDSDEAKGG